MLICFASQSSVAVLSSYQLTLAAGKENVCILTPRAHFDPSDCLLWLKGPFWISFTVSEDYRG